MTKIILIVEDERPMIRALEHALTKSGFRTIVALDGIEALKLIETEEEKIDAILLDLILPNMDGFTVLEQLKEKDITIPVIVLTNLSQKEDKQKVLDLGAKAFFVKTDIQLTEIVEQVEKLFS
jgi:two-component system, OmpR family, alkaline phosphatase synthesis response regulator PhoP